MPENGQKPYQIGVEQAQVKSCETKPAKVSLSVGDRVIVNSYMQEVWKTLDKDLEALGLPERDPDYPEPLIGFGDTLVLEEVEEVNKLNSRLPMWRKGVFRNPRNNETIDYSLFNIEAAVAAGTSFTRAPEPMGEVIPFPRQDTIVTLPTPLRTTGD